jgi:chromate transporter
MAQIAMIEDECVRKRAWLTAEEFSRGMGLCMFLPGPEAQQLAAWVAWRRFGILGAIIASLLFILPGLLLCGLLAWAYVLTAQLPVVGGVLAGARAAVAGIILVAGYKMFSRTCVLPDRRVASGISFVGLFLAVPFIFLAMAGGLYAWFIRPEEEGEVSTLSENLLAALRRTVRYLVPVVGLYLLLWLIFRHDHGVVRLVETSMFAVLASFGGAYAALGIWQVRSEAMNWLKPGQFGDALVAGEATPGPLLLAGSFVAFVAGYHGKIFAGSDSITWGVLGLIIAAVFTFYTSTAVILAFAPLAEEGVGDRRFHDVVGVVSALAVGAIMYLGLSILLAVWTMPLLVAVAAGSGYLFYQNKLSVPVLIGFGALVGLFSAR